MLLRKRPRAQVMKRTTSLTEFSVDAGVLETVHPSSEQQPVAVDHNMNAAPNHRWHGRLHEGSGVWGTTHGHMGGGYLSSMVSPRMPRRNSGDFSVIPASFLKACGLCKRRLAPGKDIYMYRGEIAFCSSECRQQQMTIDERKEKCSLTSRMKGDLPQPSAAAAATATAGPEPSGSCSANGETVASA